MSEMHQKEEIRSDDRVKFLDRVKRILRWRIKLSSSEVANRFESVRAELKKRLYEQAAETKEFESSVE